MWSDASVLFRMFSFAICLIHTPSVYLKNGLYTSFSISCAAQLLNSCLSVMTWAMSPMILTL